MEQDGAGGKNLKLLFKVINIFLFFDIIILDNLILLDQKEMIYMEDVTAYIVLDHNILNWRWFKNRNTFMVYLWLLSSANLLTEKIFNETVSRGSVLTNNATIASECGLTIQNVRIALSNLVKTGDIKREYRNHYQIITVTDFEEHIAD